VQPFFSSFYRAGEWLPLGVTVTNSGSDVTAVVAIRTNATYQTTLELPRGAKKSIVLYIRPLAGALERSETVRVLVGGVEVASAKTTLKSVGTARTVFGLLTEQLLTVPLPGDQSPFGRVHVLPFTPADLPERGEGLSMFDALIVDGAPLADLSAAQQQALTDWVRMGGQLVLGGSKLEQLLSQLPEQLRLAAPGPIAAPQPIALLAELDAATPSSVTLTPAADTAVVARVAAAALAVQREIGAGRVTQLGLSLSAPELAALPAQSAFWPQLVRPPISSAQMNGMPSLEEARAQQFAMALMTLPVLAMPPLGLLAALLALYMLVIGPGLYFVLRRVDRQAWGWVAIPVVTLIFSLGAYGYGLRLRGNDIVLNQLTVIEPSAGRSHVQTYAGIFSPRSASYDVISPSDALFQPLINTMWGGATGASVSANFAQGGAGVRALDVTQWSMSSFSAEQMVDGAPLGAELTLSGNTLRGSVRNTGVAVVRGLILFQGSRILNLGDLQPGESRDVTLDLATSAPMPWDGPISMQLLRERWDFSKPVAPPADIRQQQMILDAMFGSALEQPAQPMLVGWLDQAPIALTVERSRIQHQQNAIVTLPVPVSYDRNVALTLPSRWIRPSFEASSPTSGPCISQFGPGWYIDTGVVTSTLQLPPAARDLPITSATVQVQVDGPASLLKLSLYDWSARAWIDQPEREMRLTLDDPARYFSEAGALQLRIEQQGGPGKGGGGGCISPSLTTSGASS
jgi:hypothetical protein